MNVTIELPFGDFCDECPIRVDKTCALLHVTLERKGTVGIKASRFNVYKFVKNHQCPSLHEL